MDREQAAEIHKHLVDAQDALERANLCTSRFAKADRDLFSEMLFEIRGHLYQDLIGTIRNRYPDLGPPVISRELPDIDSDLRWDQVQLPSGVSEADIDAILLAEMAPRWRKVARVIVLARDRCRELGLNISDEALAARLLFLAEKGRIEDFHDLRRWGWSEVRLKD
jgi:hypothetical protein